MLEKHKFMEWLRKERGTLFARNSSCNCPLARYLPHTVPNGESATVVCNYVIYSESGKVLERGELPGWALAFIHWVDAPAHRSEGLVSITGAEALEILETV